MSQTALPVLEKEKPSVSETGTSLMTPLGVVEGEVLGYLDRHEVATLRRLNQDLRWPAYMVMMAVGALVRAGLVRGVRHDLEVVLKPRTPLLELRAVGDGPRIWASKG